jgi:CRISPR/Cas system CSM-associated protein Csm2 small subunit
VADTSSVFGWIVAGGGGTLIGGVITAFLQSVGARGKARADAADASVNAATKMMDRLERETTRMRESILELTAVLDAIVDEMSATSDAKTRLRAAIRQAKLAAI